MKQISYQEAIELMAFAGRKDIYMGKLDPACNASLDYLRDEANNGAMFFVDEAEPAHDSEPAKKPCVTVPVPGTSGETVRLLKTKLDILADTIASPAAKPTTKQRELPRPVKKGSKKTVDVGKIMALHRAGWTGARIAEEMDISPATVSKYLKMEDAKNE